MRIQYTPMRLLVTVAGCGLLVMANSGRVLSQGENPLAKVSGDNGAAASPIDPGGGGAGRNYSALHRSGRARNRPAAPADGQPTASGMIGLWLAAAGAVGVLALGGVAWLVWRSKRAGHGRRPRSNVLAAHLVQTRLRKTTPAGVPEQQASTTRRAA